MDSTGDERGLDQPGTASAQAEPVISVRGLVKRYGSQQAVAGIDLDVRRGEIFAFLGPNGAGKTTTVEILEGFRRRTGGEIFVLGHDPATAGGAWRDRVGVVLQESEPEPGLSVRECLAMYAGFYRAPRDIDETISLVGLTGKAGTLATRLSGGQRRRLDFALALIGDPELIFLDEPTTGFDPSARRAAWEVVAGLRQLGKTIFLTTHYMDEAEYLADRIAVLSAGRVVAHGTPRTLGGRDHMATAISFTLPAEPRRHVTCPKDCAHWPGPGRKDRRFCTPKARSSISRCSATGRSAAASTFPTSTSTARPWKMSTSRSRQLLGPCGTVPGRCGDGSGEPVLVGVGDGLGSVADAGFGEEVIDVAFYCGLADHQPAGDLYVGQSLGDQGEHFGFSLREPGG